jgi:hypothetical protein
MLCFPVRDGSSIAHRTRAHAINPKAPFCLITPWVTTITMAFKFHTVVNLHIIITFRIQFNKSTPKKIYIKCDRTFILSLLSCIFSFAKRVKLLEVGRRTLYLATITIHRYLTLNIVTNACNVFQLKMFQV